MGSFVLILGVLLLVMAYVLWPLRKDVFLPKSEESARSRLLAEQERLLNALRELDFDHTLGKVLPEDYEVQRAALIRQGAEVMRQLDELARARDRKSQKAERVSDDLVEEYLIRRRSERAEKGGGFCPNCGKAVLAADRFCSHCGHNLQEN
jgi:hypothetical protein